MKRALSGLAWALMPELGPFLFWGWLSWHVISQTWRVWAVPSLTFLKNICTYIFTFFASEFVPFSKIVDQIRGGFSFGRGYLGPSESLAPSWGNTGYATGLVFFSFWGSVFCCEWLQLCDKKVRLIPPPRTYVLKISLSFYLSRVRQNAHAMASNLS